MGTIITVAIVLLSIYLEYRNNKNKAEDGGKAKRRVQPQTAEPRWQPQEDMGPTVDSRRTGGQTQATTLEEIVRQVQDLQKQANRTLESISNGKGPVAAPSLAEQAQMRREATGMAQRANRVTRTTTGRGTMPSYADSNAEGGRITDDTSPIMSPGYNSSALSLEDARRAVVLDAIFRRPYI